MPVPSPTRWRRGTRTQKLCIWRLTICGRAWMRRCGRDRTARLDSAAITGRSAGGRARRPRGLRRGCPDSKARQRDSMTHEREADVVVIGAGLGGLLAAAQFLRRGRRVVMVERLAHPGGRFTAKTFQGAQVSTGAVHMLPFGSNGELAGMLRLLGVPHRVHDAEVFASFHVRGRQYICRSVLQLAGVLGPRQFAELFRLGGEMLFTRPSAEERGQSFAAWLEARISRRRSPELYAYFERMAHFALSVDLPDVAYPEVVEITKNMLRYGAPGIVDGGCAALTGELERRVLADGGEVRLLQDVLALEHDDGAVTGVRVRDKATGDETLLRAPLVISNIGPAATRRLAK